MKAASASVATKADGMSTSPTIPFLVRDLVSAAAASGRLNARTDKANAQTGERIAQPSFNTSSPAIIPRKFGAAAPGRASHYFAGLATGSYGLSYRQLTFARQRLVAYGFATTKGGTEI